MLPWEKSAYFNRNRTKKRKNASRLKLYCNNRATRLVSGVCCGQAVDCHLPRPPCSLLPIGEFLRSFLCLVRGRPFMTSRNFGLFLIRPPPSSRPFILVLRLWYCRHKIPKTVELFLDEPLGEQIFSS